MQNKKILTLPALVIISLLVSGVGFSHWEKIVTINGVVQTGTLCAKFVPPVLQLDQGNDWTCDEGIVNVHQLTKNVGSSSTRIVPPDNVVLEIRLDNVYPSYYNSFDFNVKNCGTIPWRIQEVIFNPGNIVLTHQGYLRLDLTGDGKDDVEIYWGNSFGVQNDPGDKVDISFEIHVLENMPQDQHDLSFTVQIVVWNWNETIAQPNGD